MNVILMHGKDTDPSQKWYPWLGDELTIRHIQFDAPALPQSNEPRIDNWKDSLSSLHPSLETTLIGHSRGGVAILRWLEGQPNEVRIGRVILVATNSGFSKDLTISGETNYGFYTDTGYDFAKIRKHCSEFIVMHSIDDQWVPYPQGVANADGLSAKLLTLTGYGHFGKGVSEIPELLHAILAPTHISTD